ncbi:hypothetical protein JYU34_011653 [Plutella xylostella]|uniref:N-terminal acetyltransferase B complex subunit MDM20 homolog n=1 Tax=Plutella xylostella TaxID=51655 RepID=A0ABQ7QD90_PLUXY|nr:hypothetical protein JYU34_011653 [Plutella xylostella]
MAVRPLHNHDGGIMERRLRPIYDWLDNGNNKKAVQEAEKVLKKTPNLQAAKALKALALLRLGKSGEATTVLDALTAERPCDDTTLQAMTISYRESQQLDKVCRLYEEAVKQEPASEELHSHLFMSYVRVGDHRAQQRAAMQLYKFAPKNPYYFWAVMSIVLQAKSEPDATKKNILLSLAKKMVDNFITENKIEAEQEARLYIMILELQEDWQGVLNFLENPLYTRLVPGSMPQACMPYLKKVGQWKRLNLLCKDLLIDNPDRWDYYMSYFDSVFELINNPSEADGDGNADDTAEKCHEFICSLIESMSTGKRLRGPYLARLELWRRLSTTGDASLLGSGAALCLQYLRAFAHKPCAVPDLRAYLDALPRGEREAQCREFLTCLGFDEESQPDNMDDVQRHVSCLGCWRLAAPPPAAPACLALANTLRGHFIRCVERGPYSSTATEFCAADVYALLAAHHYYYAAQQQQSSSPLLSACALLELLLRRSPANFHAKLLLVQLYHTLGNGLAADHWFSRLDVKHVQLVSLGWLHAARLPPALAPARAAAASQLQATAHKHHAKDSVEHLTYAYKYGTFEKLVSLLSLQRRMAACAGARGGAAETAAAALLAAPAPPPPPPGADGPTTDNRDLKVIVNWQPYEQRDHTIQQRSFEQDGAYVQLKEALLQAVSTCTELADTRPAADKRGQADALRTLLARLGEHYEKCQQKYDKKEETGLSVPLPSRIIALVNSPVPYRELYVGMFTIVADLSLNQFDDAAAQCERVQRLVGRSVELLSQSLTERFSCDDPGWVMREALEDMGNYCEFIGFISYAIGLCSELLAPASQKKKKKTGQSPAELLAAAAARALNHATLASLATLDNIFELWPQYVVTSTPLIADYKCPVEERLKTGHAEMLTDIRNILKKKAKHLKTLFQ